MCIHGQISTTDWAEFLAGMFAHEVRQFHSLIKRVRDSLPHSVFDCLNLVDHDGPRMFRELFLKSAHFAALKSPSFLQGTRPTQIFAYSEN